MIGDKMTFLDMWQTLAKKVYDNAIAHEFDSHQHEYNKNRPIKHGGKVY